MANKKTDQETINEAYNHFKDVEDDGGFEDINLDTMAVPFLKVLQDLSPWCKSTKPEYNPDARPGQVVNSVTGRLFDTPIRFVVGKFERVYLEWKPKRGGFAGMHSVELVEGEMVDGLMRDEDYKLINPKTGNHFQDTYIYYVLLPDYMEEGVCIMSMAVSQLKEAKKLNRNLTMTCIPGTTMRAKPWFMIWELHTMPVTGDKGDWHGISISLDAFVTPEQLAYVAEQRAEIPKKTVDYAQLTDDAGAVDGDVPY